MAPLSRPSHPPRRRPAMMDALYSDMVGATVGGGSAAIGAGTVTWRWWGFTDSLGFTARDDVVAVAPSTSATSAAPVL